MFSNQSNRNVFSIALALSVFVTASANADLVYEDQADQPAERESTRETLQVSEQAKDAFEAQQQVQQPAAPVQSQALTVNTEVAEERQMSKTDLIRRERMRQEVQNEDMLQVRLEELRLEDEKRRTNQLVNDGSLSNGANNNAPAVMEQQIVSDPYTQEQAPVVTQQAAPIATQSVIATESDAFDADIDDEETLKISVQPRGGLSDMSNADGLEVNGRFNAGVGVGFEVSDNLTFEVGYTYGEFGIGLAGYTSQPNFETLVLRQNIFDGGLKVHLLGARSKFRPFVGGGAGYAQYFVNYDDRVLSYYRQYGGSRNNNEYEASSWLGYLSTGFDVRLSKSISVGALFKYNVVLTSREDQPINPYGFAPYGGYYSAMTGYGFDERQQVGGSLARSSFYSVLAGVTFTF